MVCCTIDARFLLKSMEPYVWICRPNEELVYDVLCLTAPAEKRTAYKRILRGIVFAANVAYWLKGFI